MSRPVNIGVIQASNALNDKSAPVSEIKEAAVEKHLPMIEEAGERGVDMLCLQEFFNAPYFPVSQDDKWYDVAEPMPGPTTELMQEYADKHDMVLVVPFMEEADTGVYYNSAAVLDADGSYLGKYRKNHIPHTSGFWEKFYFKPGNLGYPVFDTAHGKVGVYICYDRHFPEGARALGLKGAEVVFNPSATVAGLSEYLWELEQPAHAVANEYFLAAINRVGDDEPWDLGRFYGKSYVCDTIGELVTQGSEHDDEIVTAEVDLDEIEETRRTWQFYRDRRPETYGDLASLENS